MALTARSTGHRIRAGTQTVGNVTSAYAIGSLPVQTDQDPIEWVLDIRNSTPPAPARVTETLDRTRKADGKYTFDWLFSIMTNGMYDYWLDTFLPSGVYSAAVTVMTYDESDTAVYLTCTIQRPDPPTRITGGYRDVRFKFVEGTIIT